MARAWLSWREEDFIGAEREFRASAEFCSENPTWRLNAGHVLFMQGDKYKEAAAFYEPIVRQHENDVSYDIKYRFPFEIQVFPISSSKFYVFSNCIIR